MKRTVLMTAMLVAASAAVAQPCSPPQGFVDSPAPTIAPAEQLVSHTEEVTIDRPLAVVLSPAVAMSLEDTIDRSTSLPGVSGTFMLTAGEFGMAGSRRLTCLTDGSTLVEQVLERTHAGNTATFRYVVWNYTSERARSIQYGVGHFVRTDLGDGRTHVQWTYSFELNSGRFPGFLGPLGRFLFRTMFLERDYAAMMRGTLAGEKARVEKQPAMPASSSDSTQGEP